MFEFFTKAKRIAELETLLDLSIHKEKQITEKYDYYVIVCTKLRDRNLELQGKHDSALKAVTDQMLNNSVLQIEIEKLREENKLLKEVNANQVVQITELSENLRKPKSMAYIIWED